MLAWCHIVLIDVNTVTGPRAEETPTYSGNHAGTPYGLSRVDAEKAIESTIEVVIGYFLYCRNLCWKWKCHGRVASSYVRFGRM